MTNEQPVDLTNCDREPIHILGRVQPHGLLLVLREPELTIEQISGNSESIVGRVPDELIGGPLQQIISEEHSAALHVALAHEPLDDNPLYVWTIQLPNSSGLFDGVIHRHNGVLILELEPVVQEPTPRRDMARLARNAIARMGRAPSFEAFCQTVAEEVRQLTSFDRVMVYQFDTDGHGSVVAEARDEQLESLLGLHYPASDIPKQARALYVMNWLRLIADVHATPALLVPELHPQTGAPLDMSFAVLRSVSPIHIEYLKNMGVGASMSISLVQHGQLWGLIACHHYAPKYISYETRAACEFLAQAVSLQIETQQRAAEHSYSEQLSGSIPRYIEFMSHADSWLSGLTANAPSLLTFVHAGGVALCSNATCILEGATPPKDAVRALVNWLMQQPPSEVYSTDRISAEYPPFAAYQSVASGVLALPISSEHGEYVVWFRPEEIQEVNWAGEPTKPVEVTEHGLRLSPRKSFELWKETVRGRSLPWQPFEIEAARRLRQAIVEVVVRHSLELARLNIDLERSNAELDAFAYVASHDLREPLRGIYNYANFLLEDYGDKIDQGGHAQVMTISRLARRMDTLLESLLQYSRVGRLDLAMHDVDLNDIVSEVLDVLRIRLHELGVTIRIPQPLPTVRCDRVRVSEIFYNLISNAAKYNDKAEKWIEIGALGPEDLKPEELPPENSTLHGPVIYVRDNGIGIPDKHFASIFRIFKRLHGRDMYGGGSGAGLTIAKKIVERHNGMIWLASTPGVGTTFFFTLHGS